MRILDLAQAQYFCAAYNTSPGNATLSLQGFFNVALIAHMRIKEGTPIFAEYRDCLLREAERNLFLSAVFHRRGLDLMSVASASMLQVVYYYSSFYSARAILGMCGAWVHSPKRTEVMSGNPGNQEIEVVRNFKKRTTYKGSHQRFWDSFYTAVGPWVPWAPPNHRQVLRPVHASTTWLIDARNRNNYDSLEAIGLISTFKASFDRKNFPDSLPGDLNTQFKIADGLLLLACWLARQCNFATDALHPIRAGATKFDVLRGDLYDAEQNTLGMYSRRKQILHP